ncbi:MAG: prepilin peptidase [Lachnospiraceae bacterium]|nr:prepilin peptidase [Lachnospiraceae bacterium]
MPFPLAIIAYTTVFLFGIVIGSFLNVCIYRIPKHETIVTTPSHCMKCGYHLAWYDLIPVFSWLFLKGRCRKCGDKISAQYPIVEAANGVLWVITFARCGFSADTCLLALAISALLVLSVIDARTYEIPFGINVFIFVMGALRLLLAPEHWLSHLTGFVAVALVLTVLYLVTGGRGIGGGDIKLMAASGLLLGFGGNLMAFFFGCLYASVIHIARMKISGAGRMLALGPYLSAGILTAIWFGEPILGWYLGLF